MRDMSDCGPDLALVVANPITCQRKWITDLSLCQYLVVALPNIPTTEDIRNKKLKFCGIYETALSLICPLLTCSRSDLRVASSRSQASDWEICASAPKS